MEGVGEGIQQLFIKSVIIGTIKKKKSLTSLVVANFLWLVLCYLPVKMIIHMKEGW